MKLWWQNGFKRNIWTYFWAKAEKRCLVRKRIERECQSEHLCLSIYVFKFLYSPEKNGLKNSVTVFCFTHGAFEDSLCPQMSITHLIYVLNFNIIVMNSFVMCSLICAENKYFKYYFMQNEVYGSMISTKFDY